MAASYRPITASTFEEAKTQLKTGETLVVANYGGSPERHIPVTCWQTFEDYKSSCKFYARKA